MYVSHARLLVMNFADCFRFYRDVMSFKVSWGDENNIYASFTREDGGEPMLALFESRLMAEEIGTTQLTDEAEGKDKSMLIVEVENVDRVFEELCARGVSFIVKPKDYPSWGIRSAYLRDPAGNLIELSGALDRSKWTEGLKEASEKLEKEQLDKCLCAHEATD